MARALGRWIPIVRPTIAYPFTHPLVSQPHDPDRTAPINWAVRDLNSAPVIPAVESASSGRCRVGRSDHLVSHPIFYPTLPIAFDRGRSSKIRGLPRRRPPRDSLARVRSASWQSRWEAQPGVTSPQAFNGSLCCAFMARRAPPPEVVAQLLPSPLAVVMSARTRAFPRMLLTSSGLLKHPDLLRCLPLASPQP